MYTRSDKYGKSLSSKDIQCSCRSCVIAQYRNTRIPEVAAARVNHYMPEYSTHVTPETWRHLYYRRDMLWNHYGTYGRFPY